ncbi:MAG: hypothetical protein ACRD40_16310 [Candidatus Acidiferrales bacterium]
MRSVRVCSNTALVAVAAMAVFSLFLSTGSKAAEPPAPAGTNLYQDVMSHKASIKWQDAPGQNYPDDACSYLKACSADGRAPKVFVLPVGTVNGRRTARAVYLVKISKDPKQPEAVVFEHQTTDQIYFIRVGPDGKIMYVTYLEPGKAWLFIANQLGQSVLDKDAADWHAALSQVAGKPGE